jgi:hypothetical protein
MHKICTAIVACMMSVPLAALADGHRQPGPSHHHQPYEMTTVVQTPSEVGLKRHRPYTLHEARDPQGVPPKPVPGAAQNTHGIIFVGGHSALNPQPIPPGHAPLKPHTSGAGH